MTTTIRTLYPPNASVAAAGAIDLIEHPKSMAILTLPTVIGGIAVWAMCLLLMV